MTCDERRRSEDVLKWLVAVVVSFALMCPSVGLSQPDERPVIQVSTAVGLIQAIGSDRILELASGEYLLSEAAQLLTAWDGEERSPGLRLIDVHNLTIRGPVASPARIVTQSNGDVITVQDSSEIVLESLVVGHAIFPYECNTDVIVSVRTDRLQLRNVEMFGSGRIGLEVANSTNLSADGIEIWGCSELAFRFRTSANAHLSNVHVHNNTGGVLMELHESDLLLENAFITDNNRESDNNGESLFHIGGAGTVTMRRSSMFHRGPAAVFRIESPMDSVTVVDSEALASNPDPTVVLPWGDSVHVESDGSLPIQSPPEIASVLIAEAEAASRSSAARIGPDDADNQPVAYSGHVRPSVRFDPEVDSPRELYELFQITGLPAISVDRGTLVAISVFDDAVRGTALTVHYQSAVQSGMPMQQRLTLVSANDDMDMEEDMGTPLEDRLESIRSWVEGRADRVNSLFDGQVWDALSPMSLSCSYYSGWHCMAQAADGPEIYTSGDSVSVLWPGEFATLGFNGDLDIGMRTTDPECHEYNNELLDAAWFHAPTGLVLLMFRFEGTDICPERGPLFMPIQLVEYASTGECQNVGGHCTDSCDVGNVALGLAGCEPDVCCRSLYLPQSCDRLGGSCQEERCGDSQPFAIRGFCDRGYCCR